uniref:Uncharacterized protein n=1 Tax=Mycena chlorophos TaxID=658473 RepID=A0ABQ0LWZ1_MYCCL|nr:predicted protein [Mycena chlorophos]
MELVHDFVLNHLLLDPHLASYRPSEQYQKTFWKWMVQNLEQHNAEEDSDVEIDSRIYDHFLALLNISSDGPPTQSYITHFWDPSLRSDDSDEVDLALYQKTTLLESRTMIEAGTTGMHLIRGKRILELGSGIGFLGAVVATLQLLKHEHGAVWLSDVNEAVLARCQDNIRLPCNTSSSHPNVRCCFLDWSAALDPDRIVVTTALLRDEISPDLILGADIVFDPSLIPPLIAVLNLALRENPSSTAIIALTERNPTTMQKFVDAISDSEGLTWEKVDFAVRDTVLVEGGPDAARRRSPSMTAAAGIKAYSERRLLFSSNHHHPVQLDYLLHNRPTHPQTMVATKKTPAKAARTSTPSSSASSDASTKKKKRSTGGRRKPTEYNKFFAAQMALLKATIEDGDERRRIISKRWTEKKAEDAANAPAPDSD